jgi:ABC-2 type transport system ATP-binding protein
VRGVTKAEFLTTTQARVYFEGDPEITERLVAASILHRWRLREISLERGQLDDTFKQLSSQSHQ